MTGARWGATIAAVLVLAGCPFFSDLPLADPANGIQDQALTGDWKIQDPETGDGATVSFRLLSLREMEGSDQGWYIARYRVRDDQLTLALVDDGLFGTLSFTTSADLRAFIGLYLSDPLLFAAKGDEAMELVFARARD